MSQPLPWSPEAEQSVLGALLLDNSVFDRVRGLLKREAFFDHRHAAIWQAASELLTAGKAADVVTVFDALPEDKREECGGLAYLNQLAQGTPSIASAPQYAEIVRDRAVLRQLLAASDEIRSLAEKAADVGQAVTEAQAALARVAAPERAAGLPPFRLLSVADVQALPAALDRVHGVYPAQGVGAIYGPSGSGKSFLVIDLMAAIASAESWFGHKVRPGRVVYVMLEGAAGLAKRIRAWEEVNQRPFPDGVSFLVESFRLLERDHVTSLAIAIEGMGGADVVVIDTLNRAAPGADENSPEDAGRMLDALQQLQSMLGGLVLVVHHTGKDATKGMRGHSSLFAAMDGAIVTTRSGDAREWAIDKVKDGRDGDAHPYRLRAVEVGQDEDGDPITSCAVVQPDEGEDVPELNRPRPPKGGNQRIVYDALGPLFRDAHTFGKAGAPAIRPCIELEAAVLKVRDRLTVEPKRRTERARQAITGLVASGVLGSNEGWIWLV